MTKDRNERMIAGVDQTGKFGFQPIEQRGHQPIKAPYETVAGGYQPTTSQTGSAPATPPSQGSSAKKSS